MKSYLRTEQLTIKLCQKNFTIVSKVSFSIAAGESLVILGQSGSGKTMTCSAILNLFDPEKIRVTGEIYLDKINLLNLTDKDKCNIYGKQIAYIPQNPMTALNPSMRIGKQMDETLRLHSNKTRHQRYNEIIDVLHNVGLADAKRIYRAYPHMLSGGMLQRIIIAMAMMNNVKFVIADEPTTALDVVHRNDIINLFLEMKKKGVGILMVTHDFATALQLSGQMLVMKEGKIVEGGEVELVFRKPSEPYTKLLINAHSISSVSQKGGINR